MKSKLMLTLLLCMAAPFLFAQDYTKAEMEIKNVIEDETHQYNQQNYDAWAAHWAHISNAYLSVAGPEFHMDLFGWDNIAKWTKENMTKYPVRENDQQKSDYAFHVNGKMAYVTFMEDGNRSTRVLEKSGDGWKILRVDVVLTGAYEKAKYMKGLSALEGTYVPVEGSISNTNPWSLTMKGVKYHISLMGSNLVIKSKEQWEGEEGNTFWIVDEMRVAMDMGEKSPVMQNVYSDDWTTFAAGTCTWNEDGSMEANTARTGENPGKYCHFKAEPHGENNEQVKVSYHFWDRDGKETMVTSMVLAKEQDASGYK